MRKGRFADAIQRADLFSQLLIIEVQSMIKLEHIEVTFGSFKALKDINIDIHEGEFFTFLGPSGCGKTMTVYENIAFGLQVQKMDKEEIRKKVVEMGKKVDLNEEQLKKKVSELSGGQQQRVAIARALVTNPEIICLDEPLSNLDAKLRVQLRNELKDLQKRFGITTVYVTHDQEEALTLSDRIAVFNKGVIEQIGRPDEIYSHSATEFVCNFIGDINRLTPEFLAGTGADKVEGVDPKKHCYIRLERMHVNETMATDTLKTEAVVEDYEFYGLYIKYTVRAFGQTIKVIEKNSGKTLYKKGDTVTLSYNPADIMQYEG